MSLRGGAARRRSNPPTTKEFVSGEGQERPRNDILNAIVEGYLLMPLLLQKGNHEPK